MEQFLHHVCLNLPLYADAAEHVVGVDTSPRLLSMARHVRRSGAASTEFTVEQDGGPISLELTGPPGTREFISALFDA